MFPVRSFCTTINAGFPNRPAKNLSEGPMLRTDRYGPPQPTKDLDEVLGGLAEVGGVHAGLGDRDVDIGLGRGLAWVKDCTIVGHRAREQEVRA
jgi:hypothetical protein